MVERKTKNKCQKWENVKRFNEIRNECRNKKIKIQSTEREKKDRKKGKKKMKKKKYDDSNVGKLNECICKRSEMILKCYENS